MQYLIVLSLLASLVAAAPNSEIPSVPVANQPESVVSEQVQPAHVSAPVVPVQSEHPNGPVQVVPVQPIAGPYVAHAPVEFHGQQDQALPANYKPFGSWGLYIGGNPQDGYYSNYYKALGASVDKQVGPAGDSSVRSSLVPSGMGVAAVKPVGGNVESPFAGGDFYPFSYSAGEIAQPVHVQHQPSPVGHYASHYASPAAIGAQIYGLPSPVESHPKPEHYVAGTKRVGSVKETQKQHQQQQVQSVKSYSAGLVPVQPYSYSAAPVGVQGVVGQPVAYPVPIGSQIVGSQYGLDGAFSPYGVHAFTKYSYAKPTGAEQVYSAPVAPVYPYSYGYQQISGYHQAPQHYAKAQPVAYPSYQQFYHHQPIVGQPIVGQPIVGQPIVGGPVASGSAPAPVSVVDSKPSVVGSPVEGVAHSQPVVESSKPEAEVSKPEHH